MKDSVLFKVDDLEIVDNENGIERGSELKEHRLLFAIKSTLSVIDRRDGVVGNDPMINNVKSVCDMAIKLNEDQYNRNLRQQKILDGKIKECI